MIDLIEIVLGAVQIILSLEIIGILVSGKDDE